MNLIINTDGGSRGNPGPGALGIVFRDDKNTIISEVGMFLGETTNNQAEYQALIEALSLANEKKAKNIICRLDSELVVKQLNGKYKVKDPKMQALYLKVKGLEKNFEKVTYQHVARSQNSEADALVNKTLDSNLKLL